MATQTLIYCVGAAKAGTSWLFDYLYHHPETYFPTVKELNYWNSIGIGFGGYYRKVVKSRIEAIAARHDETPEDEVDLRAYQIQNMADLNEWLVTFDGKTRDDKAYLGFIGAGLTDAALIGDFSPAYALLKPEFFAQMAESHPNVKFLYLLREPVDRLWSHCRMDAGAGAEQMVDRFLDGEERDLARRSNYRRTIRNLMKAVPDDRVHVELYERLFSEDAMTRLCDFLDIDYRPADFGARIHASPKAALDPARRGAVEKALGSQYNFIENFLGALPGEWTERMVTA